MGLQSRGAKIPGDKSPGATKFCMEAPNIRGSLLQKLLHASHFAPRILRTSFFHSLSFHTNSPIAYASCVNLAVGSIVITRFKIMLPSVMLLNDTVQTAENNCCLVAADRTIMNGESRGERDFKSSWSV